jgi:ABC-type glycerol-3-phosphate transport system substrate-binding protein
MKKISFALVGAAALALAACGGRGDDSLGENVQENYDSASENLEMMAENTTNEVAADTLQNQAQALETEGERKEEAIDDADVNASNTAEASAAVNAM